MPKTKSKPKPEKKEKVASRVRERGISRERQRDKVRISFACANHVADKARLATFKYLCKTHILVHT